jgi:hypothetical protein
MYGQDGNIFLTQVLNPKVKKVDEQAQPKRHGSHVESVIKGVNRAVFKLRSLKQFK